MIQQSALGLNSRSLSNPYNENGFLPLLTAPMYSVVDENNYQVFLDNKIQVCLPRNTKVEDIGDFDNVFFAMSLEEFIVSYIEASDHNSFDLNNEPKKVCIDTANGNMPLLHNAIRKAKEIHGDNLVIMAGNVGSVEAFVEIAKTGVAYIRVGIGGGGNCNTTSNTGVGQKNLKKLIQKCYKERHKHIEFKEKCKKFEGGEIKGIFGGWTDESERERFNIANVRIIADGISTWIKYCEKKHGYNDNGYAAINELLFAGADLVMVGKLFAQCLESAGEKAYKNENGNIISKQEFKNSISDYYSNLSNMINDNVEHPTFNENDYRSMMVRYAGMSTREEQKKYKTCPICKGNEVTNDGYPCYFCLTEKYVQETGVRDDVLYLPKYRPSEGLVEWISVRWTLSEWLNGHPNQDSYPYLIGFTNALKSAMSYTGKRSLEI